MMVTMSADRIVSKRSTTRLARVAPVVVLALCFTTVAGPADGSQDQRAVKKIKKALVDVEHRLDTIEATLKALERRSKMLDDVIAEAEKSLAKTPPPPDGAFSPGLAFLSNLVRVTTAEAKKESVEGRITEVMEKMQALITERDEKIDELQVFVRRAKKSNEIAGETTPTGGRGTSLTVGGSLITYSADWEAVALCESSGNWHINSQYDGGLQFHPNTWIGFGGGAFARYAYQASKHQQIAIAERVLAIQGPGAWPNCFRALPIDY